jgi:hypothetical protein
MHGEVNINSIIRMQNAERELAAMKLIRAPRVVILAQAGIVRAYRAEILEQMARIPDAWLTVNALRGLGYKTEKE